MDTLLTYSLIAAIAAGILAVVADVLFGNAKRAIADGIIAAIFGGIGEFVMLYVFMPNFAHWTSAGYFYSFTGVAISALLATAIGAALNPVYCSWW